MQSSHNVNSVKWMLSADMICINVASNAMPINQLRGSSRPNTVPAALCGRHEGVGSPLIARWVLRQYRVKRRLYLATILAHLFNITE